MRYLVSVIVAGNPEGDLLEMYMCPSWRWVHKVLRTWKHRPITITRSR